MEGLPLLSVSPSASPGVEGLPLPPIPPSASPGVEGPPLPSIPPSASISHLPLSPKPEESILKNPNSVQLVNSKKAIILLCNLI